MTARQVKLVFALSAASALAVAAGQTARSQTSVDRSYVAALNGPCGIAIDSADRKIIADTGNDRVLVLDKDFEPVGVIEALQRRVNPLKKPEGVSCGPNDEIVVADTGNHCVKVFNKDGHYQFTIGSDGKAGSRAGECHSPQGVTVDRDGNIIVFDTGNKRVQVFGSSGAYIMQFREGNYSAKRLSGTPADPISATVSGKITLNRPVRGCVLGDGALVVADQHVGLFSVWHYDTSKKTAAPFKYTEPKEWYTDEWMGDVAYDGKHNEIAYLQSHNSTSIHNRVLVAKVDTAQLDQYPEALRPLKAGPEDWMPYYETDNFSNGRFIEPRGMAFDSQGNLVVVDRAQSFAVQISRRQIAEGWQPHDAPFAHRLIEVTSNSALIEYDTRDEVPIVFEYGRLDGPFPYLGPHTLPTRIEQKRPMRRHRVRLGGLDPGTRYAYRYLTTRHAYPREHFCEARVVTTAPRSGQTAILDLRMRVVLFTDIVEVPKDDELPKDDMGNPIVPEKPGPMTADQIARVKTDLERARGFFWVNSHLKMNLLFDYIQIDEHYEGFPFSRYAYFPDADRTKLEALLAARGHDPRDPGGGTVIVYGARHYDASSKRWVLSGSGGNTWGSSYSGTGICVFNAGGDTAWLFTHEYGHVLDMMARSFGHRYHFNHFHDNDLIGDYGMHWDGNAYIARTFSPDAYLANFYGSIRLVRDADSDGFPDDDPRCPFDEKRFGTRSNSSDSDSDGVSDLAEVMFSQWLTLDFETFGARTALPHVRPKPYGLDTDGDTIPDANDAFPLVPMWPKARKTNILVDGQLGANEWHEQSSRLINDPAFKGAVRVNWRDEGLCFLIEQELTPEQAAAYRSSDRPMRLRLELDGNNDGLAVGSDNSDIEITVMREGVPEIRTVHCDNTIRAHTVWSENTVIRPEDVKLAWNVTDERFVLELMVPCDPQAGINCVLGEQIGFSLEFWPAGAEYGLRLFEPQVLFDVTLE
ncbi:MAG: hypothetical protein JW889_09460 [Verrucomicrobia bacterium]|nr:hypothetical protein [Verrucomicrobiota bacterium]